MLASEPLYVFLEFLLLILCKIFYQRHWLLSNIDEKSISSEKEMDPIILIIINPRKEIVEAVNWNQFFKMLPFQDLLKVDICSMGLKGKDIDMHILCCSKNTNHKFRYWYMYMINKEHSK